MLDMRTVLTLTVSYCLFIGLTMFFLGRLRHNSKAFGLIGIGIMTYGIGFLILSFRDLLSPFMTIILANYLILVGVAVILEGLTIFRGYKINWWPQHLLFSLATIGTFLYFTYKDPNVNYRILIITMFTTIMFVEMLIVLFKDATFIPAKEALVLSFFFIATIVLFIIRMLVTLVESPLISFMDAGTIHSLSVTVYQVLPFLLSITTFWMSNSQMEHDLRHISMMDALTGLYNRAAIMTLAEKELDRYQRQGGSLAIAMCDIDHFKLVNDTYGHQTGDYVLQAVAQVLKDHIRLGDYLGRYGGEEFLLILHAIESNELYKKLEHLRTHIESLPLETGSHKFQVTMSFGGMILKDSYALKDAIARADRALYDAKNKGRNRVIIFSDNISPD